MLCTRKVHKLLSIPSNSSTAASDMLFLVASDSKSLKPFLCHIITLDVADDLSCYQCNWSRNFGKNSCKINHLNSCWRFLSNPLLWSCWAGGCIDSSGDSSSGTDDHSDIAGVFALTPVNQRTRIVSKCLVVNCYYYVLLLGHYCYAFSTSNNV